MQPRHFTNYYFWIFFFNFFLFSSLFISALLILVFLVVRTTILGWEDVNGCLWMAAHNISFLLWSIIYLRMEQIWTARTWRLWGSPYSSQTGSAGQQFYLPGFTYVLQIRLEIHFCTSEIIAMNKVLKFLTVIACWIRLVWLYVFPDFGRLETYNGIDFRWKTIWMGLE